MMIYFT